MKWIGVDFDHTLAKDDLSPVTAMVDRVRQWRANGIEVRIVTARVNTIDHTPCEIQRNLGIVQLFCIEHFGAILRIQSCKSSGMLELWDDKVVPVYPDTGQIMVDYRYRLKEIKA